MERSQSSTETTSETINGRAVLAGLIARRKPAADAEAMAERLLQRFGSLRVLSQGPSAWNDIEGMDAGTAVELAQAHNLINTVLRAEIADRPLLDGRRAAVDYCRSRIGGEPREYLLGLFLDKASRLIGDRVLQPGTVDHVTVYPREILRQALLLGASGIVLAHNHPSGSVNPSARDVDQTERLARTAREMGIAIIDHIIISDAFSFSFRANGLMPDIV